MNAPGTARPRRRQSLGWLAGLCLALLLLGAQSLAQAHRIAHALPHADDEAHGWGHAAGSADCRILDQLAHEAAPSAAPPGLALPVLQAEAPATVQPAPRLAARWGRSARAPPLSSLPG